ncbi:hypothetical protein [Bradyrhizobium sp. STM 3562]|uniref:hypothetical protein n=1 Tax=Bradyrhizobium sp. STM 3562 TaxID=578924 RepID=UPI00388E0450
MKTPKSVTKLMAGSIFAGLLAIAGTSVASAQSATATFNIQNSGTALTLDIASCSPSAPISAPFSIGANGSASFSATGSGSILCTVRYKSGSDGCQFVVDATNFGSFGGFANSNSYMGDSTPPSCTTTNQSTTTTGYQGSFQMTH